MKPFRFSIQAGPFTEPDALPDYAVKLEDLGYAELWSFDHIGTVDPFLPLLSAAAATTKLRFGPLVINNEFHNPVLLARTAATFDRLTNGRLVLALGTGYAQDEHDAADIELRPPPRRVTRLDETVQVLRSLFDTGSATLTGSEISINLDALGVDSAQDQLPIWIGGNGKRVVTIAGKRADGLQLTGMSHEPETGKLQATGFETDAVAQRVEWLTDAAGDRLADMDLSALVQKTAVGDNTTEQRQDAFNRMGCSDEVIDETPFVHIGSTQQVVEKLQRLREQFGIHHFTCRDPDDFAPVVAALADQ